MAARRVLVGVLALVVGVVSGVGGAGAATGSTAGKSRTTVKCHWVKATKKRRRRRVCVKVKVTKKVGATSTTAGSVPAAPVATGAAVPPVLTAPNLGTTTTATTTTTDSDPATVPVAARVQATANEWSMVPSRTEIAAGPVIVELVNAGQDAHNLHIEPASGGADVLSTGVVDPTQGEHVTAVSGTLAPGTYTLYCSLPGHATLGMQTTLTVR